jgi:DNA-nicking Smr family endonuclease
MRRSGREPSALELMLWRHMVRDVRPRDPTRAAANELEPALPAGGASPAPSGPQNPGKRDGDAPGRPANAPGHPRPADVDRRTLQRLQRGQYPISGRLDLHGRTQAEAYGLLVGFITAQHARGTRCVLVITGRGLRSGGILRAEVPRWLAAGTLAPLVLAIAPARIAHGGEGAFYVLLRRRREQAGANRDLVT